MEENRLKETVAKCKDSISGMGQYAGNALKNCSKKISGLVNSSLHRQKFSRRIVDRKRFALACGVIVMLIIASMLFVFSGSAYSVKVNGAEICKVRNQKSVEGALQVLKQRYKEKLESEINFTSEISYDKTRASKDEVLSEDSLVEVLGKNIKFQVQTCSIYADGNKIAVLKSREQSESLLKEIQDKSLRDADRSKLKEIGFAEKVELKDEFADVSEITDKDEIINFIMKGTNEARTHTIVSGESFWSISRKYNMSLADLQKSNPGVNPEKVKIGQVISLIVPKPLLSVRTVQTITSKEKADFEQKVEFSSSLYKDESTIRVKGVYGEKEVVADVIKINGVEVGRNIISEKVLKEPKTQIIVKGTKEPPPKKGTGTFSYPARGSISSPFGMRWGRRHTGIDIAAPYGSAVKASDGGVVTFVGWKSGYGKLIIVDHGANFVSYYGHLSAYKVKVGQKVYKGQTIGAVGSTGNSTGPHLHFEIRKNGVIKNPSTYLK